MFSWPLSVWCILYEMIMLFEHNICEHNKRLFIKENVVAIKVNPLHLVGVMGLHTLVNECCIL